MRYTILSLLILVISLQSCRKDEFNNDGPAKTIQFDVGDGDPLIDPANTKVLIVGVLTYLDAANLGSFNDYHRKDMELMETLINYGLPHENVIGLFDEEATRANIIKALHKIATTSGPETNFIFYFAGHGFNGYLDDASSIYFANYDIKYIHPETTGFNINFLVDNFRLAFPGNSVFLMADCCKSGGLVNIAEEFSTYGYKAVALTSCFYTDWSTGDWTFTQKVIDAFKGDGLIDGDENGTVTLNEMIEGVSNGLKFVNRQRSDAGYFNCSPDDMISTVTKNYPDFEDDIYYSGQYVFGKYLNNYRPVQIIGKSGGTFKARYYNFSDYVSANFEAADLKIPYFVHYEIGENILLDEIADKPGVIIGADNDFYEVNNPANGQIMWRTYETIISDDEIPAMILNPVGEWVEGQILDQLGDEYYVTYSTKLFQWDEWVGADKVEF